MDKGNELAALAELPKITFGFAWLCLIPMCFAFCRQDPVSTITLALNKKRQGNFDFKTHEVSVDLHLMTFVCGHWITSA